MSKNGTQSGYSIRFTYTDGTDPRIDDRYFSVVWADMDRQAAILNHNFSKHGCPFGRLSAEAVRL